MKVRDKESSSSSSSFILHFNLVVVFVSTFAFLLLHFPVTSGQQQQQQQQRVSTRRSTDYYSDRISFPEVPLDNDEIQDKRLSSNNDRSRSRNSKLAESIRFAQQINTIESYDELLAAAGVESRNKSILIAGRFGGDVERSNAERPKHAVCSPQLREVSLVTDTDPSKLYLPECTRVKICSGCCMHPLLSCQPTAKISRNFEVTVRKTTDDFSRREHTSKEIVTVEEHTKCECLCKIKQEHCTEKQVYYEDECRCDCTNTDEKEKCKSNHLKLWNQDLCTCQCRNVSECSTGLYFDQNTCRCKQVPILSRFGETSRTGYSVGQTQKPESVPPVIVVLDASDPRRKPKEDPEYK